MAKQTSTENGQTKFVSPTIIATAIAQTQKVMNLDNGDEDATIKLAMTRYSFKPYDPKDETHGTPEQYYGVLFTAAAELIQPVEKQIDALLYRATQDSYQAGKTAALATGNFLSSDLKAKIVQVMRGNQAFAEMSAKECFDYWKDGFSAKKPGAVKVLDTAKALGDFEF